MKALILLATLLPTLAAAAPATDYGKLGLRLVEDLTTEIGPRLPASPAQARARDWAAVRMKALGFKNVRIEPFAMSLWQRGAEEAQVVSPYPQRLSLVALANSSATPDAGLTAPVVMVRSLAELEAATPETVRGRIVFVTHSMTRTQDGSSYGFFGDIRRRGPALASSKGAAAILIRSIGTDNSRSGHTGWTSFGKVPPLPAAALGTVDADLLERIVDRGQPVTLRLRLTPTTTENAQSGNVIGEIPGSDPKAGIVLVGAHLDSWDLGTGAIDDASGIGIVTAAAKSVLDGKRPRRTIRVVWFGAEEPGLIGGFAYRDKYRNEPHALATEADFGADRVWRVDFKLPAGAKPLRDRIVAALAPLGIAPGSQTASGDSDVGPLVATGVNAIDMQQDGTRYFDLHHTAEDTFDKVDARPFAQAVEAYARMLRLVADAPEDLLPAPR